MAVTYATTFPDRVSHLILVDGWTNYADIADSPAFQAQEALASKGKDKKCWSYVYSPDADFVGPLENSLPSFWKPSLSRLFATESNQPRKEYEFA